jgi:hypothetical protein
MTKKTLFAFWAFICAIILFAGCSGNNPEEVVVSKLNYRYVSAQEGRQILLSNTAYFNAHTQTDIVWKSRGKTNNIDEFKTLYVSQIEDFTDEEKKALDAMISIAEARFDYLGVRLPATGEVTFVKCSMEYEGDAGGFTLGNSVFISTFILQILVDQSHGKRSTSLVYDDFIVNFFSPALIIHELFHCMSRNDAGFRQRLYSLIGFTVMDHEVEFGPTVRNRLYMNPDVERYDNWAEFTINGEKRRCILVSVYDCDYAEVAETDPNASFINYLRCILVPLDDPDTLIPVGQASDFFQIVGSNTTYLLAAEECMAENFCLVFGNGLNGYYDFWDESIHFVPYSTPELIHRIYETMLELYPR